MKTAGKAQSLGSRRSRGQQTPGLRGVWTRAPTDGAAPSTDPPSCHGHVLGAPRTFRSRPLPHVHGRCRAVACDPLPFRGPLPCAPDGEACPRSEEAHSHRPGIRATHAGHRRQPRRRSLLSGPSTLCDRSRRRGPRDTRWTVAGKEVLRTRGHRQTRLCVWVAGRLHPPRRPGSREPGPRPWCPR